MDTLRNERVVRLLERLHRDAETADRTFVAKVTVALEAAGSSLEQMIAEQLIQEQTDYRTVYRSHAEHFLAVSPDYGRFLYAMARAVRATRIVEFGTSMGISTIYLAAAVRDNGGGRVIGTELEPGKVERARGHLEAAGLGDLVDIREGDALETLKDVGGEIDLLLLDGAFALYLPVLQRVEPRLRPGAVILGENAFAPEYLSYVRDPANGYISQPIPIDEGRGNEFTVRAL